MKLFDYTKRETHILAITTFILVVLLSITGVLIYLQSLTLSDNAASYEEFNQACVDSLNQQVESSSFLAAERDQLAEECSKVIESHDRCWEMTEGNHTDTTELKAFLEGFS